MNGPASFGRGFHPDVRRFLIAAGLSGLGFIGFASVLFNLYLLRLGYGTDFIGLANGSTPLAFAIASLPAGAIGSRFGPRRAALSGYICLVAGAVLLPPVAQLEPAVASVAIVMTRMLTGVGFSLFMVNAQPYLVASTSENERVAVFAAWTATTPLAGFAGGLIAGFLPSWIATIIGVGPDHPLPFGLSLFAAGLLLLPGISVISATSTRVTERRVRRRRRASPAAAGVLTAPGSDDGVNPMPIIIALGFAALLRVAGEGAVRSFFNVLMEVELHQPVARIGLLSAIGNLAAGPAALLAPMVAARRGISGAIVISTLLSAVGMVLLAVTGEWLLVGIGFVLVVGAVSLTSSVSSAVHMEIVPPAWRGTTAGAISMAMGVGYTGMSLGGGYLIPVIGFDGVFFTAAALTTLSALLYHLVLRRRYRRDQR